MKPCNFWSRIIPPIGITSFNMALPSSESMSLCTRDDATLVSTNVDTARPCQARTRRKTFKWKHFTRLKASMDLYRYCICPVSYLKYVFTIYKVNYDNRIGGIPVAIVMLYIFAYYPWVVFRQCTAFQWWRHGNWALLLAEREFPNYVRPNRDRISDTERVQYLEGRPTKSTECLFPFSSLSERLDHWELVCLCWDLPKNSNKVRME